MMTTMSFVAPTCRRCRLLRIPPVTPLSAKITSKASDLDALSQEERTVANVFRMAGPSIAYVESVMNPPRGTRGRKRTAIGRIRRSGSGRSKVGVPPPRIISLGYGSGFVISEER